MNIGLSLIKVFLTKTLELNLSSCKFSFKRHFMYLPIDHKKVCALLILKSNYPVTLFRLFCVFVFYLLWSYENI